MLGYKLGTEFGLSLGKDLGTPLSVGGLDGIELVLILPLGPSLDAALGSRLVKKIGIALGDRLGFKPGTELGPPLSVGVLDGTELG
jgi:hypothetical protein